MDFNAQDGSDWLPLIEDDDESSVLQLHWRILVVDDDEEVCRATKYALADIRLLDRPLELLFAKSAAEAESVLRREENISVILLDVVMESNDAGLRLVEKVRGELGLLEPRIILRTGQPGYAPELDVISRYDINDYRSKTELTQVRLITSLTSALRSYEQIHAISNNRRSLQHIVDATSSLLGNADLQSFASDVLTQVSALFAQPVMDGFVVMCDFVVVSEERSKSGGRPRILAGSGRYEAMINRPLAKIGDARVVELLDKVCKSGESVHMADASVLFFPGSTHSMAAYVETVQTAQDQDVIEVFCRNIGLASDNLWLIDRLRKYAFEDELTGLPNRTHFIREIERRMQAPTSDEQVVLLDIDHFNVSVDTIGYEATDELLRAVATRLQDEIRGEPMYLARLHGDVFALIGPKTATDPDRIKTAFREHFHVRGLDVSMTATVGLAPLGSPCSSAVDVISGAYAALKQAKELYRGGSERYTADMKQGLIDRTSLLRDLHGALRNDDFDLAFQPQIRLADGRPAGLEVLIRWRTSDGVYIPPNRFIPIAESSGLIVPIGEMVFRKACARVLDLRQQGWPDLCVAVNVSTVQLHEPGFVPMVEKTLDEFGVEPSSIDIEITETMAMQQISFVLPIIHRLKAIGVRVSLDDFGTGFSSLSYLHRLNIDHLKVDRSFVVEIGQTRQSERIAETIISLAHKLGLVTIAEGVETEQQAEWLKSLGCELSQGYFYAKPMDFPALSNWLDQQRDA